MTVADSQTLRLERTFDASPEEVFDAWTNPEVLRRWWKTEANQQVPVTEVDLRVGGSYRLAMEEPDGATHEVRGRYREVRRPERLVYSWAWVLEDGSEGHMSTVTVDFRAEGDRTTVVVEHTDLESESRERHGQGWTACLESLRSTIFARTPQPS